MEQKNDSTEIQNEVDLLSSEKLDRSSPDLWPQMVPGLSEFASLIKTPNKNGTIGTSNTATSTASPKWMSDLNKNDIEMLTELANMSSVQMVDKVKDLIELGYQLGIEESNQMTRGRLLNILDTKQRI